MCLILLFIWIGAHTLSIVQGYTLCSPGHKKEIQRPEPKIPRLKEARFWVSDIFRTMSLDNQFILLKLGNHLQITELPKYPNNAQNFLTSTHLSYMDAWVCVIGSNNAYMLQRNVMYVINCLSVKF
jgi:hypothetical protein